MNRIIKFRAWDESKNIMHKPGEFALHQEKDNGVHAGFFNKYDDWTELKLMQFTGLKDKNGVEIYEGDIVENIWHDKKFITGGKQKSHYRKIPIKTKRVVEWDEHWASWKLNKGVNWGELEVLGNIYENPELGIV